MVELLSTALYLVLIEPFHDRSAVTLAELMTHLHGSDWLLARGAYPIVLLFPCISRRGPWRNSIFSFDTVKTLLKCLFSLKIKSACWCASLGFCMGSDVRSLMDEWKVIISGEPG